MSKISLRASDRVFVCGKTGSGKTYLMQRLTASIKRLVVLDGKGTLASWGLAEWDRASEKALFKGEPVRVRVTAPLADDYVTWWEDVFGLAFSAGNLTVYVDEAYTLNDPGTRPGAMLRAVWTRGREFGIGAWAATQRPTWLPLFIISEADHFFVFRLTLSDDRRRMSEFMGEEVMRPIKDKHGFYFMAAEDDEPEYLAELEA